MSKTLKMGILLIIITLGFLFLAQTKVSAVEINSTNELNEIFEGKNATVNGTTITLTGDVTLSNEFGPEVIEIMEGNYTLDLNGHTLTVAEIYLNGGTLTINDSNGKGKLECDFFSVEKGAKLLVNNAIFSGDRNVIANVGEIIINNGTFHSIWNSGTITIENGNFKNISNDAKATINGGTFTAYSVTDAEGTIDYYSHFNLEAETVISGGTFEADNKNYPIVIYSKNPLDSKSINKLAKDGYLIVCGEYSSMATEGDDYAAGYGGHGGNVRIIKDEAETIFNKIAPNGVWNTNTLAPTNTGDSEFLLSAIADDFDLPKGYELMACVVPGEPFDASKVNLYLYYNGSYVASKTVKATYTTPNKETLNAVNKILAEIDKVQQNDFDVKTSFRLEDLYLINYLNASSKGIDESMALNFAKDLIELTNGGNVVYKLDARLGEYNPIGLWDYKGGQVIVYYNGKAINTTMIGVTVSKVLYVPMDTANTDEARMNAAMNRIKEYLGTTKGISIKVGGTLRSLNVEDMTWNQYGLFDETTSGDNYYIVNINGKEYKFIICKKANLETPKYIASDVMSNILIKSDDTSIPLDAALTVKEVKNDTIEKALGTSVYAAYDISLYSNAKQVNITKLENGKFIVSIPVPEIFKNKGITVYYINSNGKKEEHIAKVENGMATFETDHFSTYVLVEKNKDDTPPTGTVDIIEYVLVVTIISALGIVVLNKKETK